MNYTTAELDNLDVSGLKGLLKDLKLYKSLVKQLGTRGIKEYNKIQTGEKTLVVEYFPALDKEYVVEESIQIFEKVFGIQGADTSKVSFIEKESIKGGMRLFVNDHVLDLTYSKIEKQFA